MIRINRVQQPKPSLFIATPNTSGLFCTEYLASMWHARQVFAEYEIATELALCTGQPDVATARNALVDQFLKTDHTHLLFIDADQGWRAEDVVRMLEHNLDIVCGAVPRKAIGLTGLDRYVGVFDPDLPEVPNKPLVEVRAWGTGFMLIKRNVFKLMGGHVPYVFDDNGAQSSVFFRRKCDVDLTGTMRDFSEDYAFCNDWRGLGGKVFADTLCELSHVGRTKFTSPTLHEALTEGESNPSGKSAIAILEKCIAEIRGVT